MKPNLRSAGQVQRDRSVCTIVAVTVGDLSFPGHKAPVKLMPDAPPEPWQKLFKPEVLNGLFDIAGQR